MKDSKSRKDWGWYEGLKVSQATLELPVLENPVLELPVLVVHCNCRPLFRESWREK